MTEAVVIVGAGAAGLATAASLLRRGVKPLVLDRGERVGQSWADRYDRLHLHTARVQSQLPGLPIPRAAGPWVSRDDFVTYLQAYAAEAGDLARGQAELVGEARGEVAARPPEGSASSVTPTRPALRASRAQPWARSAGTSVWCGPPSSAGGRPAGRTARASPARPAGRAGRRGGRGAPRTRRSVPPSGRPAVPACRPDASRHRRARSEPEAQPTSRGSSKLRITVVAGPGIPWCTLAGPGRSS